LAKNSNTASSKGQVLEPDLAQPSTRREVSRPVVASPLYEMHAGKRQTGYAMSRQVARESTQSTREWKEWLEVVREFCAPTRLNYTFHHTSQPDLRPHLAIRVFGQTIRWLLDSGASRTAMGRYYWDRLKAGSYKLQISPIKQVTVANGARCEVIGSIALPIELHGRVRVMNVLIVPELGTDFLLGIDFWQDMDIRARLKDGTWHFAEEETPTQLCSLETQGNLTEEERKQ
ncbi:hypothetical protein CBL_21184, partial [Carabus blaptoides fortunei]